MGESKFVGGVGEVFGKRKFVSEEGVSSVDKGG